jgi:hypothetical protein
MHRYLKYYKKNILSGGNIEILMRAVDGLDFSLPFDNLYYKFEKAIFLPQINKSVEIINNAPDQDKLQIKLLQTELIDESTLYFLNKIRDKNDAIKFLIINRSHKILKHIVEKFILLNLDKIDFNAEDDSGKTIVTYLIEKNFYDILQNEDFRRHVGYNERRSQKFNNKYVKNSMEYVINGHGGGRSGNFTIVPNNTCIVFLAPSSKKYRIPEPDAIASLGFRWFIETGIAYNQFRIYTQNSLISDIEIFLHGHNEPVEKCDQSGIVPFDKYDITAKYNPKTGVSLGTLKGLEFSEKLFALENYPRCEDLSFKNHNNEIFGNIVNCKREIQNIMMPIADELKQPISIEDINKYNEKYDEVEKNYYENNMVNNKICEKIYLSDIFSKIEKYRKEHNPEQKFVLYLMQCRDYDHGYDELNQILCYYDKVLCPERMIREFTLANFDDESTDFVTNEVSAKIIAIFEFVVRELYDKLDINEQKIIDDFKGSDKKYKILNTNGIDKIFRVYFDYIHEY